MFLSWFPDNHKAEVKSMAEYDCCWLYFTFHFDWWNSSDSSSGSCCLFSGHVWTNHLLNWFTGSELKDWFMLYAEANFGYDCTKMLRWYFCSQPSYIVTLNLIAIAGLMTFVSRFYNIISECLQSYFSLNPALRFWL